MGRQSASFVSWRCDPWRRQREPDSLLKRLYRMFIGIHIFSGWRSGLKTLALNTKVSPTASHLSTMRI
jgi:hypothetical protein